MKLYLYINPDKDNKINKRVSHETILNINLKQTIDILNPVLILSNKYKDFNYCYLDSTNRYYFINKVDIINNDFSYYYLSVDTLMTYKDYILNTNFNIVGSENPSYSNESLPTSVIKENDTYKSDVTLNDDKTYIINTIGTGTTNDLNVE